jgi:hypothetical protein
LNHRYSAVLAVVATSLGLTLHAAPASAQRLVTEAPSKYFVSASAVFQNADQRLVDGASFPLYDETATFASTYDIDSSGGLEIGGGLYVWNNLGVGVTFARIGGGGGARVVADLPHPVLFNSPRQAELLTEPDHSQRAVHVQVLWTLPIQDRLDVTVGVGPSFHTVNQQIVTDVAFVEGSEPFRTVTLTGTTESARSETAMGFNIGVDSVYMFSPRIGGGLTLRYTGATVDLRGATGHDVDLDAGGFQAAVGLRLRF